MDDQHRGIKYSIVRATRRDVWEWRVVMGNPKTVRKGEATTAYHADMQVRKVIDRVLRQSLRRDVPRAD
jgi:hypothetical protein